MLCCRITKLEYYIVKTFNEMYFSLRILSALIVVTTVCGVKIFPNQRYNGYQKSQRYQGSKEEISEEAQDLTKIPGEPGVDYPLYHSVPDTSFSCASVPFAPGIYANVETGCQAYHVCHDGREGHQGAAFLCSNGTLFNQQEFTCDWWYKVDCKEAPSLYRLNADEETNPFAPKQKSEEQLDYYKSTPYPYRSTSSKHYKPNVNYQNY